MEGTEIVEISVARGGGHHAQESARHRQQQGRFNPCGVPRQTESVGRFRGRCQLDETESRIVMEPVRKKKYPKGIGQ
jgi:hypothetical protein